MGLWDRILGRPAPPEEFATLVLDAMKGVAGDDGAWRFHAEDFSLRRGDGTREVMFLGNVYEEYRRAGRRERQGVVDRFLRIRAESDREWTFDDALPNLLPRVRPRAFYGDMVLRARLEGWEPPEHVFIPLAGFLALGMALDLPESVVELQGNRLREWNVDADWLRDAARRNLARRSEGRFHEAAPGVFVSPWRDNHDASRLVLTEMVRRLNVRGRHVAFIPNRDTLIITGDGDADALAAAHAMSARELDVPRPVTGRPLVLEGETWLPLVPPDGHPLRDAVELERVKQDMEDHGSQKSLLDALHQRDGADIFVASLTGVQRKKDGRAFTYAVWSRDTVTLLPRADRVVFMDGSADPVANAPWDVVTRHVGNALTPVDGLYPERFRVERLPAPETMAAIRADAGDADA